MVPGGGFMNKIQAGFAALLILAATGLMPASGRGQKKPVLTISKYAVDIEVDLAGTCGPERLATFSQLKLKAAFGPVHFKLPADTKLPCGLDAGDMTNGRGKIMSFKICPEWIDNDSPVQARVRKGPKEFIPSLECVPYDEVEEEWSDNPLEIPISAIGPTIWLRFSPVFSVTGEELSWQFEGIGSGQIGGYEFIFAVSRDALAQGRLIELNWPVSYPDIGESGTAHIVFIPLT
jgi:hypothetical protein